MRNPIDIKEMAKESKAFRRVVDTGKFGQLVLISLRKGEDLGEEMHPMVDELYYVLDGVGENKIDGKTLPFDEHGVLLVPAGAPHRDFAAPVPQLIAYRLSSSK